MDKGVNHILNVTGILKNFSIAKKITATELKEIKKRVSEDSANSYDYESSLKQEILRYTDNYIKKNKIPGLIINKKSGLKNFKIKNPKYARLYKEASLFARSLKLDKKLSKKELIFFIISVIGYLELNQSDFENFNKELNYNPDFEENDNGDDEGGYDDDDDDDDDDDEGFGTEYS